MQYADNCYPADIWAGTLQSGKSYHAIDLNNGSYRVTGPCGTGYCPNTLAFSVRCVGYKAYDPMFKRNCGLQLCDYYSDIKYTPGSVRCREGYQQCKGAAKDTGNADNCYPADIWANTQQADDVYYMANLGNGSYGTNHYKETLAFSVRHSISDTYLYSAVFGYKHTK